MKEVEIAKNLLLGIHSCETCGEWGLEDGPWDIDHMYKTCVVKWVNDPFIKEIENKSIQKWYCYECYYDREMEILKMIKKIIIWFKRYKPRNEIEILDMIVEWAK